MPSMSALYSEWHLVSFFFDVCMAFVSFFPPSLPPAVFLEYKNIGETEKGHVRSQKKSKLPLTNLNYTALTVFTDWSLFVVVVWCRAQRLYRGWCDWYHMKDGVVWASEHRYHSGES